MPPIVSRLFSLGPGTLLLDLCSGVGSAALQAAFGVQLMEMPTETG